MRSLACLMAALALLAPRAASTQTTRAGDAPPRHRVLVSTDIGGSDNDDFQSMIHLLVYADQLEIEGLLSSPPAAGRVAHIHEAIDAYALDFPHLRAHADYPAPEHVHGLAKQGATEPSPAAGYSEPTEASQWIIERAKVADARPLYVLVWGSITDVAQAVHDAPEIKTALRVYSIGSWNTGQDRAARDYLFNEHPDLWWIEADGTFRGMYVGGEQAGDLGNREFLDQHVRGHGALGQLLVEKLPAIKMGDSPSVLYLLSGDANNPEGPHWGGSFVRSEHGDHYWTDAQDPALKEGRYTGARTVNTWREEFLRDWQARMDRCLPARQARTWALWDAEGQHLTTDEILEIHRAFGAGTYFFRSTAKQGLDLRRLNEAGLTLIQVAHPGYAPFNEVTFLDDEAGVRTWAQQALASPEVDGIALDIEGATATTHKHVFQVLSEEARASGKTMHAVPHFAHFDRWENTISAEEMNVGAEVVWPWLYNRFRKETYSEGLRAMLGYWRDQGVTRPTYPLFDHGRVDYSGITPAEAAEAPLRLKETGVDTVCLFQPHASYRARAGDPAFSALWQNLADAYGKGAGLINANGWFVAGDSVLWGWVQHNGWWRDGQRPNLTRRSVGDPRGDLRPNRTEDFEALTDNMLRFGYPGFEHNYGLWYDRRRDAHDTGMRADANAMPPFLEQPWARSSEGTAADGLPKYDLTSFNPWYFDRLKAFADLCDRKGTVLLHKFYMQHALLESQTHYVDFPWRPANCVQETALPDTMPAANAFYDVAHPVRRELHRLYIRKCLDVLGANRNVVHLTSQEFTGPLPFVQFWLDTIVEWEQETGKDVCIGLGAPKDVQDAILQDAARTNAIEVIDPRYWWLKDDGTYFAPGGGQELPGRGLERGGNQAAQSSALRFYEKLRSLRDRYPGKGIIDAYEGGLRESWAFLMAGGSLLVRGGISYPGEGDPETYIQPAGVDIVLPTYRFLREHLATQLPRMQPADIASSTSGPAWCLADGNRACLVFVPEGGVFTLDFPATETDHDATWFNPRAGEVQPAPLPGAAAPLRFETPTTEDWALWITSQTGGGDKP